MIYNNEIATKIADTVADKLPFLKNNQELGFKSVIVNQLISLFHSKPINSYINSTNIDEYINRISDKVIKSMKSLFHDDIYHVAVDAANIISLNIIEIGMKSIHDAEGNFTTITDEISRIITPYPKGSTPDKPIIKYNVEFNFNNIVDNIDNLYNNYYHLVGVLIKDAIISMKSYIAQDYFNKFTNGQVPFWYTKYVHSIHPSMGSFLSRIKDSGKVSSHVFIEIVIPAEIYYISVTNKQTIIEFADRLRYKVVNVVFISPIYNDMILLHIYMDNEPESYVDIVTRYNSMKRHIDVDKHPDDNFINKFSKEAYKISKISVGYLNVYKYIESIEGVNITPINGIKGFASRVLAVDYFIDSNLEENDYTEIIINIGRLSSSLLPIDKFLSIIDKYSEYESIYLNTIRIKHSKSPSTINNLIMNGDLELIDLNKIYIKLTRSKISYVKYKNNDTFDDIIYTYILDILISYDNYDRIIKYDGITGEDLLDYFSDTFHQILDKIINDISIKNIISNILKCIISLSDLERFSPYQNFVRDPSEEGFDEDYIDSLVHEDIIHRKYIIEELLSKYSIVTNSLIASHSVSKYLTNNKDYLNSLDKIIPEYVKASSSIIFDEYYIKYIKDTLLLIERFKDVVPVKYLFKRKIDLPQDNMLFLNEEILYLVDGNSRVDIYTPENEIVQTIDIPIMKSNFINERIITFLCAGNSISDFSKEKDVDQNTITTTDIRMIEKHVGILAARYAMIKHIHVILSRNGINVDPGSILLIADHLTSTGSIISVSSRNEELNTVIGRLIKGDVRSAIERLSLNRKGPYRPNTLESVIISGNVRDYEKGIKRRVDEFEEIGILRNQPYDETADYTSVIGKDLETVDDETSNII